MFVPTDPPAGNLREWLVEQLQRLGEGAGEFQLDVLHVAPAKPREGLVVMADGTDWNPGAGKGVYVYYSSAWHYMTTAPTWG